MHYMEYKYYHWNMDLAQSLKMFSPAFYKSLLSEGYENPSINIEEYDPDR